MRKKNQKGKTKSPKPTTNSAPTQLKINWVNHFAGVLLIVFGVFSPFIFNTTGMDPTLIPRWQLYLFFLVLFSVIVFIKLIKHPEEKLTVPKSLLPIIGFAVIALLSRYWAVNENEAIFNSLKYFTLVYGIWLFYILLKTRLLKEVYILASIFLLGVTSMVIGYGQIIKSKTFLMYQNTQNSLTGSEANENLFGSIVLLCLPAAIYWFKKNIPGKILAIIYWILGGILIVKTGSRTATLAFLCVSVFSVIMLLNVGILKQLKYKFLTMFLIVIGAGIGLLIWHQNNPVLFRHDLSLNTLSLRLKLWDNSLKMINDNPILGVGAGNWKIHFPVYGLKNTRVTAEVGSMSFVRPHNDFLWIASEMGIPAFLLFISTIIWLVISGLKAISRNQNTALNLVVISTLMGLVITSMADFPMERQNHLVVFALAAAIGVYVNNKKAINLNPILGFIALFLSLAAVGFSLNVANNQFKGEQWSQKMVAAYTKRNIQQMQALYATQDFKYYNLDRTTVPLPYFAGMTSLASNNPADATFYFQQALQIHPNHLLTVNNAGAAQKLNGNLQEAIALYKHAINISPNFRRAKENLTEAYFLNKQYVNSLRLLDELQEQDDEVYDYLLRNVLQNVVQMVIAENPDLQNDEKYKQFISNPDNVITMYKNARKAGVPFEKRLLPVRNF